MKVTLSNGKQFEINFRYGDELVRLKFRGVGYVDCSLRTTYCTVTQIVGHVDHAIASGKAHANTVTAKDQFCKVYGRRLSLDRALQMTGLTRAEKKEIWAAYHNRGKVNV